jgi:hypothetical protein
MLNRYLFMSCSVYKGAVQCQVNNMHATFLIVSVKDNVFHLYIKRSIK